MSIIAKLSPSNPLVGRLFRGAAWGVIGAVFTRMLALILSVAMARILQTERFGQFLIIQNTLGMFGVFAGLGLGVVATKFAAELHARDPERLGRILNLVRSTAVYGSIIVSIMLALLARNIASDVFGHPELTSFVRITAATVVFLTIDGYNTATLFGIEHIKQSVQGTFISSIIATPVAILLTWEMGLAGAVYGVLLSSILQCLISHIVLNRALRERAISYRRHGREDWSVLYQYALPSLLGGVMVAPVHWLCQAMLANQTDGMVQVAVLGIGFQWFQAVSFLPIALARVVLPVLTDVTAGHGRQQSNAVLKSAIAANAIVAIPAALGVALLSGWIMRIYGVTQPNAGSALSLMVAASAVSAICTAVGQIMVAKGQIWQGWMMNVGWAVIYVGLTYMFISFGAIGVASSLLIAYIAHGGWVSVWTWINMRSVD